jgi:hypothetical protein
MLHQEPAAGAQTRANQVIAGEPSTLGLITTCSNRAPAVSGGSAGRKVIAYSNHRTFEISPTQE